MDLDVYGLCLGGNVFGWTADRDASFAVLDAYVEAGGNFIDTADTYMRPNMGISETIIGEWMAARGNRDSLVIATKVGSDGGLSAANIAAHVDGSLQRLQTDRIDLYYAHKDDGAVPVEETVRAFDQTGAATARCARRGVQRAAGAAGGVAGVRRARGAGALRVAAAALQPRRARRLRARLRADRRVAYGLDVAPYYALATGLPDRQVPRRAATATRRAREGAPQLPGRARRGASWPRWTRSPPRTASPVAAVADRLAAGQAGRRPRRSPAPARPSSWPPSSRPSTCS